MLDLTKNRYSSQWCASNARVSLIDLHKAYQKYADGLKSIDTDTMEGAQKMDRLVEAYNSIYEQLSPMERKGELKLKGGFVDGLKKRMAKQK